METDVSAEKQNNGRGKQSNSVRLVFSPLRTHTDEEETRRDVRQLAREEYRDDIRERREKGKRELRLLLPSGKPPIRPKNSTVQLPSK